MDPMIAQVDGKACLLNLPLFHGASQQHQNHMLKTQRGQRSTLKPEIQSPHGLEERTHKLEGEEPAFASIGDSIPWQMFRLADPPGDAVGHDRF